MLSFLFQDINVIPEDQEDSTKEDIHSTLSTSNSIDYQWNITWGESGIAEGARALALDSSGNIYLAGFTNNTISGDFDMCLVKFDNLGQYQWNRTWGGSYEDSAAAIGLDSSDNIYLAGGIGHLGGETADMCLVKFDSNGQYQWNRTWGGSKYDFAHAVALDSSDNIYLAGKYRYDNLRSDSDVCLVKFDSNGQYLWNRTWGGSYDEEAYSIALDSSDNIYLAGYIIVDDGPMDFCLVKFNNLGDYQWNSTWGGSYDDHAFDIALDSSENIYLAGFYTIVNDIDFDFCLVKFNNLGEYLWNRTFGGNGMDWATSIVLDSSDNIYIGGVVDTTGLGNYDFCLVECDNLGFQQWNHTWGGSGFDAYWDIILDSLQNVYLAGTWDENFNVGNPDMLLVKVDTGPPQISITSPDQYDFFGTVAPTFDLDIIEPNLNTTWYTLDDGFINKTFIGLTGTINQTEWDKKNNGTFTIIFYANDSFGREGYAEVVINKDLNPPTSSIYFIPHSETIQVNKSTTFTLTADDGLGSGVSVIRYRINNSGWIDYTNLFDLSSYAYGDYLISYQAIDLVDNIETVNTLLVRLVEIPSEPSLPDIPGYSILLFIGIISMISIFLSKKQKQSINSF